MIAELGTRIPVEVRDKVKSILDDSIAVPCLSFYLQYAIHVPPMCILAHNS